MLGCAFAVCIVIYVHLHGLNWSYLKTTKLAQDVSFVFVFSAIPDKKTKEMLINLTSLTSVY